jgi:hypothetical protein
MSRRIRTHIRSNLVGYVALFIALGGTAWAANGPLAGRNTVGSSDIINSEVKSSDVGPGAVGTSEVADDSTNKAITAGDIANAPSGSDALDADALDGFDSTDFAAAADVHVSDRQKVNDPTPGDLTPGVVPLFSSGSVSLQGECSDNLSIGNEDRAEIRLTVTGGTNSSVSAVASDLTSVNIPSFGGSVVVAGVSASNVSNSNLVNSSYFTVVAGNGEVVSGSVSAELNDADGGASDCTFGATGIG